MLYTGGHGNRPGAVDACPTRWLGGSDYVKVLDPEVLGRKVINADLHIREGRFQRWLSLIASLSIILAGLESMLNQSWGMPKYNYFGTDEFLSFCRLVGTEPLPALKLGNGKPQEAAE